MNSTVSSLDKHNLNNLDKSKFRFAKTFGDTRLDQIVGKPSTYFKDVLKRFVKNPWAMFFLALFFIVVLLVIFAPIASPYGIDDSVSSTSWAFELRPRWPGGVINGHYEKVVSETQYQEIMKINGFVVEYLGRIGPQHRLIINPYALPELQNIYPLFGTDPRGIDIWTKTWVAAGNSLWVSAAVAVVSILIGSVYGGISGAFAGKWPDTIMMRIIEILSGVPTILWLLLLGTIFSSNGTSLNLQSLFFALISIMWMGPASLTRLYILKSKDAEYIQAVRTLGGSQFRIIFIHMLPNISGRLLVRFVHIIPSVIFFESTLVYLGLKDSTELGLGTAINDGNSITSYIAPLLLPALILVVLTLSAQIVANALNDAVDPRVEARK